MTRLFAAFGAATMMLSATAAPAEVGSVRFGPESVTVKTADLDLKSAAGSDALNRRVADAAQSVCGEGVDRIHLLLAAEARACRAEVIASLAPQIEALTGKRPSVSVEVALND